MGILSENNRVGMSLEVNWGQFCGIAYEIFEQGPHLLQVGGEYRRMVKDGEKLISIPPITGALK